MKNKELAFNLIGELCEYVENWLYFKETVELEYILEKLAEIQNIVNNYL